MNLKISFFNKSLFKSDMKRYWWVGLIETLFLLVSSVIPIYSQCRYEEIYKWRDMPMWDGNIFWLFVFSVAAATLLFTYLHFTASVSTVHSLPIKRSTVYFTKIIAGGILTMLPIIINAIILYLITFELNCINLIDVLRWAFIGILYTAVFFSLACFVNKMTGNPVGTIVFTIGFLVLPVILFAFYQGICAEELYGYVEEYTGYTIIERIYASESDISKPSYFIPYIIATGVFVFGGFLLYVKRKLENYGEVIAFSWLKPVFIAIVAIIASFISYVYFSVILQKDGIWWIIPMGLIGTVVAWMISKKSIKLKGVLKPVLIYIAYATVFCSAIEFDFIGFERRIPDISDIKSAWITDDYNNIYHRTEKGIVSDFKGVITNPDFTEEEDIKNVMALHKYLIENRDFEDEVYDTLRITYELKNGDVLKRRYIINEAELKSYLKPLYETEQIRAEHYALLDGLDKEFIKIQITDERAKDGIIKTLYPNEEQMQKLLEALIRDSKESTYEEMTDYGRKTTQIHIDYAMFRELADGKTEKQNRSVWYSVTPSFENTFEVLENMKIFDMIPKNEDIKSVNLKTWKRNARGVDENIKTFEITEPEKTELIYTQYEDMFKMENRWNEGYGVEVKYTLNDGQTFTVSTLYHNEGEIPEVFKEYF